ncbi:hypothetical protein CBM2626_U50008 [Cupriavidus taiwanensis]|uniref:Uncharacterized protein n=1 Tax=Cupriavidus taiwanensis TaxID=164546 RepID=A0A375EHP7_9BURK|nr:hypothetical protein CBM2614_U100008 [Cupriavidus taiwanensis]SOZ73915.1 hypothetical protein CBM2615_U40007 [Cupriavidus taiwanensis]SOZ75392.1 hypothetical protein CBM2613_U40008 [Cupriavidus taiwanensis]SPA03904.1 hypothetical protein CBM2626_U50008 [Cupriavidus taiwanensis]SPA12876.1 hypothetical protein CBM2625_U50009 [Cupriavidus taiwanensis]
MRRAFHGTAVEVNTSIDVHALEHPQALSTTLDIMRGMSRGTVGGSTDPLDGQNLRYRRGRRCGTSRISALCPSSLRDPIRTFVGLGSQWQETVERTASQLLFDSTSTEVDGRPCRVTRPLRAKSRRLTPRRLPQNVEHGFPRKYFGIE